MKRHFRLAALFAAFLAWTGQGLAQPAGDKPDDAAAQHKKAVAEEVSGGWLNPPVEEALSTTTHSISAHGKKLTYTANAGTLTIRNLDAKPIASVFYVAYTLGSGKADPKRPVTFFYNGGPGSPTIWLHMGSFGPMRVKTDKPVTVAPAPYNFGPNPNTLLDKTDLVFIDAIGAGFSRPVGDAKGPDFWGVDEDVDAFAKAIIRYVTKFDRWNSPKYLFGESYGTTRTGALSYVLEDNGLQLNGSIILSSILNYGRRHPGYDEDFIQLLPTYAATAWYHDKIPNKPADVATIVEQARQFARDVYAPALAKGDNITGAEEDQIASQMSALIGIDPTFIKNHNLRVDLFSYRKELLRDQHKTIGRLDSRYIGTDPEPGGERPEYDPASTAITGAYYGAFSNYIKNDLKYKTGLNYNISARIAKDWTWDWQHKAPGSRWPQNMPDVAIDLNAAMRINPHLKVLSLNGYFDMATPFFATEYDISHMMLEPAQKANVTFHYYPAGHMIYLDETALGMLYKDLAAFYDSTAQEQASARAGQ